MIDYNFFNPGICLIISSILLNFIPKRFYKYSVFILLALSYSVLLVNRLDFYWHEQLLFGDLRILCILTSIFFLVFLVSLLIAIDKAALASLYVGATVSILFTKNLLYIFLFLEMMMVASSLIILKASKEDGMRYFRFHVLGGTFLLIGIMNYYFKYNSFELSLLQTDPGSLLILLGLLVNLAIPPFSSWLLGGYMVVPHHIGLIFSICTTKISALILLKLFAGLHFLVFLGLFTASYAILYAFFERDIKRFVLYLILAEIGMILIFIGVGEKIMSSGLVFIINDMLCIPIFLSSANLIALGKAHRWQLMTSLLPVLSSAAFPFTLGYVSKRYLYEAEYLAISFWLPYILTIISYFITYAICLRFAGLDMFYKKQNYTQHYALPFLFLALLIITLYLLTIFGVDIITIDKFFIKQALLPTTVILLAFLSTNYITHTMDVYKLDPNALYMGHIHRFLTLFLAIIQNYYRKLTYFTALYGSSSHLEANLGLFIRTWSKMGIGMGLAISAALLVVFLLLLG